MTHECGGAVSSTSATMNKSNSQHRRGRGGGCGTRQGRSSGGDGGGGAGGGFSSLSPPPARSLQTTVAVGQGDGAGQDGVVFGESAGALIDGRVSYGAKQSASFDRHGFILLPRFLSRQGLAYLRDRVDAIYREKAPSVDGEWITNLHQLLPPEDNWMWALATHPTILKMVELRYHSDMHT